jgi:hypothetical protein
MACHPTEQVLPDGIPKRVCLFDVFAHQLVGPLHQDRPAVRRFEMQQVVRNLLHPMEGVVLGVRHLDGGLETPWESNNTMPNPANRARCREENTDEKTRIVIPTAPPTTTLMRSTKSTSARCMNTVSMK